MEQPNAPDMACVSVSTAESPVYNRDLPLVGPSVDDAERAALRFLIKECGWYWLEAGVLRRHRFHKEVA
tara:strand:+ start:3871 stop:4077 length:207 start_codon:yes stop_codon:yes gene_type:complete